MQAAIQAIEYYLPQAILTNDDLAREFPEWTVEKIEEKTGIVQRHIAAANECSSDLAIHAARQIFQSGACQPSDIDFVLLCTQSPDYLLPTTACIVQDALGIPTTAGALDFNLGCSGYIYGLGLAKGLIETGQAQRVLLLTAETYSKFIHAQDKSVRTLFGDAAAATLVQAVESDAEPSIGPFVYGTDGKGAPNLIVSAGGARNPEAGEATADEYGNVRAPQNLYMKGPEIFNFTLRAVPQTVQSLLDKTGKSLDDVDLFVFHQANQYMLEHLRKKLKVPSEKFYVSLSHCGNTVSSTIPIALKNAQREHRLAPGALVMLVGFGVGYSWGATFLRWTQ